jgi:hypothetical protein
MQLVRVVREEVRHAIACQPNIALVNSSSKAAVVNRGEHAAGAGGALASQACYRLSASSACPPPVKYQQ